MASSFAASASTSLAPGGSSSDFRDDRKAAAASDSRKSARDIVGLARNVIGEVPLARIDYIELVDTETLQPVDTGGANSVLVAAVFFGKTRLIDNIRLP